MKRTAYLVTALLALSPAHAHSQQQRDTLPPDTSTLTVNMSDGSLVTVYAGFIVSPPLELWQATYIWTWQCIKRITGIDRRPPADSLAFAVADSITYQAAFSTTTQHLGGIWFRLRDGTRMIVYRQSELSKPWVVVHEMVHDLLGDTLGDHPPQVFYGCVEIWHQLSPDTIPPALSPDTLPALPPLDSLHSFQRPALERDTVLYSSGWRDTIVSVGRL